MRNKLAVKICGLNSQTAIDTAIASGVDYLGFVFFPPSPRSLTPEIASRLMEKRSNDFKVVAVVVNPSDKLLEEITYHLAPDIFQLHGSETAEDLEHIKQKFNTKIIKAMKISEREDFEEVSKFDKVADFLLFDAAAPLNTTHSLPGGNGISFNWNWLSDASLATPWFLSGGLNIGNINEAVETTGATAVDVSSGVEDQAGIKNNQKIIEFMNTVRTL
ncbi:MAG: phosphoribosylanthranilate isomerase [Pseudomonadota bacterium]|jgi:phosphoribosylanthranilate isomerase|nr:phosphoribosylanthranilate isomerase [Pseudomonadota bacterium]|tara:strand:+ start:11 stop:664 length:654 start_codon:yes stop_codon:yes gene_type:complete